MTSNLTMAGRMLDGCTWAKDGELFRVHPQATLAVRVNNFACNRVSHAVLEAAICRSDFISACSSDLRIFLFFFLRQASL